MDIDMTLFERIESLGAGIRGIRDHLAEERRAIDAAVGTDRRRTGPPPPDSPARRVTDNGGKDGREDG